MTELSFQGPPSPQGPPPPSGRDPRGPHGPPPQHAEWMHSDTKLEQTKRFVFRHFERLLVVGLVASLLFIHRFIEYKLAFLSFYYLPIIAAGFLVGRRMAVWAALFVVLFVAFIQAVQGLDGAAGIGTEEIMYLVPWGGFLILTGYCVGALAEQRKACTDD